MPRRRNSELSWALRRAAIEGERLTRVIERELARQRCQVIFRQPHAAPVPRVQNPHRHVGTNEQQVDWAARIAEPPRQIVIQEQELFGAAPPVEALVYRPY